MQDVAVQDEAEGLATILPTRMTQEVLFDARLWGLIDSLDQGVYSTQITKDITGLCKILKWRGEPSEAVVTLRSKRVYEADVFEG